MSVIRGGKTINEKKLHVDEAEEEDDDDNDDVDDKPRRPVIRLQHAT